MTQTHSTANQVEMKNIDDEEYSAVDKPLVELQLQKRPGHKGGSPQFDDREYL